MFDQTVEVDKFQKASLNTIQFPTVQHWNAMNLIWQTDHYYTAQATWTDMLQESTDNHFNHITWTVMYALMQPPSILKSAK